MNLIYINTYKVSCRGGGQLFSCIPLNHSPPLYMNQNIWSGKLDIKCVNMILRTCSTCAFLWVAKLLYGYYIYFWIRQYPYNSHIFRVIDILADNLSLISLSISLAYLMEDFVLVTYMSF